MNLAIFKMQYCYLQRIKKLTPTRRCFLRPFRIGERKVSRSATGVADPRLAQPHHAEPPERECHLYQAASQTARVTLAQQHALRAAPGLQGPAMKSSSSPPVTVQSFSPPEPPDSVLFFYQIRSPPSQIGGLI